MHSRHGWATIGVVATLVACGGDGSSDGGGSASTGGAGGAGGSRAVSGSGGTDGGGRAGGGAGAGEGGASGETGADGGSSGVGSGGSAGVDGGAGGIGTGGAGTGGGGAGGAGTGGAGAGGGGVGGAGAGGSTGGGAAGGSGGGDAGGAGGVGTGGVSGTGGAAGSGGVVTGGAGNGGNGGTESCTSPGREPCEWEAFAGLACDAPSCCGEVSCVEERCLDVCGTDTSGLDTLAPDFHVLARFCGVAGSVSIVRGDEGCERPVVYRLDSFYNLDEDSFPVTVTRFEPSVQNTRLPGELVQSLTWPSPGGPGNISPATFAVSPNETKALFTLTLDSYDSTSIELDLDSGATRTLEGRLTDRVLWLDDQHYLTCSIALGTPTPTASEGIYYVDASGADLVPTFVAGRVQCLALGMADDHVVIGGSPIVGGTDPALAVVPLALIDDVVSGNRVPIDIYTDADVQRIPREVWELQGYFPAGRWFVSPANPDYTEYRVEALSLAAGELGFGPATPLGVPGLAGFTPLYAGNDRLMMVDYTTAYLVDFR